MTNLKVSVARRDADRNESRWDRFSVTYEAGMTIADVLDAINADPRTTDGQPTNPIAWASACTWPACGVCTMLINGRAAPACGTTVDAVLPKKKGTLRLAPMDAFAVRRDLRVDRTRMRADAARATAYVVERSSAPDDASENSALADFSGCTRCGACLDACPEAHERSVFMGPYALGAVFATRVARGEPLPAAVVDNGGIGDCGHVQNCVGACPEAIPLDRAIRGVTRGAFKRWVGLVLGRSKRSESD